MLPVIDLDYPFLPANISKFVQNQCFDQNILTGAAPFLSSLIGSEVYQIRYIGFHKHLLLKRLWQAQPCLILSLT